MQLSSTTPTTSLTLAEGLQQFKLIYMPARNYAARTREEYERDITDLMRFLEQRGIQTWLVVGLRDLQQYLAELDRRLLQPSSRNRKTFAIKTFFQFLHQAGYLRTDPARQLIPPPVPQKERRFLRETEYQALLAQISSTRDRAIMMVFLQTGILLTELVELRVEDVELPEQITPDPEHVGLLKVHRNGSTGEVLPLNWKACEVLRAWLNERQQWRGAGETRALFLSSFQGQISRRAIRYLVKKYMKQAGIEYASVQSLRHTMATQYLAKGGDLKSVQELLGHESIKTTAVYLPLAKKAQRRMVQELAL